LEFQNFSSSGFQSEIQVVDRSLISRVPWFPRRRSWKQKNRSLMGALGAPPDGGVAYRPVVGPRGRRAPTASSTTLIQASCQIGGFKSLLAFSVACRH
jgi:hypothetical protein